MRQKDTDSFAKKWLPSNLPLILYKEQDIKNVAKNVNSRILKLHFFKEKF